ncbi:MAG: excinuclease ABC subunit UvrC [Gammaproteobacteria bacterium]|nr:excinuclease ABC subunit UvrC [Gammaproteobacteria bacterium]
MNGGFDARGFVASLPRRPGIYRMYAGDGALLYVGKAKSLRDRVGSYFLPSNVIPKVQALVAQIASMEVTVTRSETEALLLEHNLIKALHPRYNVVLRDDKSFPYLWLSGEHAFPRLSVYRGNRNLPGRFFGPYPNAGAVGESLHYLQKIFRLRNCRDTYFAHRSRPCLQHQIGRCSAPCVGLVTEADYARDVQSAVQVLEGRNDEVQRNLAERMEHASERLEFERAAALRDQIAALKELQAQQVVAADDERDADVFAIAGDPGGYAVIVMPVRGGRSLGTSGFFPRAAFADPPEALSSFLMQYYSEQEPPAEIYTNLALEDAASLGEALTPRAGRIVRVRRAQRGLAARWVEMAAENAGNALRMRLARREGYEEMRMALAGELGLESPPTRLECFDISHTQGEGTVASCVVFGAEGPLKRDYRRFNIEGVAPGDDYGALRVAVARRAARIAAGEVPRPDLLIIDGGPAQLAGVVEVLAEAGFAAQPVIGVSKGADRKAGQERIHFADGVRPPWIPGPHSEALKLIQRLRDEAHRFAISGHRRRRARRFSESILETVPGLGPAKRRALLQHFGGLQGVLKAGRMDLERAPGIGPALAQNLYDALHPGE